MKEGTFVALKSIMEDDSIPLETRDPPERLVLVLYTLFSSEIILCMSVISVFQSPTIKVSFESLRQFLKKLRVVILKGHLTGL